MREPITKYRLAHEVVSEIKGGITVKLVFLKRALRVRHWY